MIVIMFIVRLGSDDVTCRTVFICPETDRAAAPGPQFL